MHNRQLTAKIFAWVITLATALLAIIVWGNSLQWHIFSESTYTLFPVFGLIAFSLLWSQYITLAVKYYFKFDGAVFAQYYNITGWLVLLAILLHPGLLIWQLWRSGRGLPPNSYLHYVIPSLKGAVILGMINLTILLLFELRRIFAKHSWWRVFTYVVDIVMFSIFYHGLRLGTQLQTGWYRKVWFFYGGVFLIALLFIYRCRFVKWRKAKAR
ncbi:MAG TPA: hypothetical protein VMR95_03885 [Candidatus Binatia bacterium]|nr:hypothetical protein [Candidatus Binatia bacterium]